MADNVDITPGAGATVATDEVGGFHYQKIKIAFGANDSATNVTSVSGLPVEIIAAALPTGAATSAKQDTGNSSLASIDGKITTVNTGAVVVSSSALPTGAATAAKQPSIGTAGSASADVITVQGIAAMTALKVDGSAVTQPISGTITANIGTSGSLALDATLTGGTAKSIVRGGAKGSTSAADVTSTASGANHQPLDVILYDTAGNALTSFGGGGGGTQYTEDNASAGGESLMLAGAVRQDTIGSSLSADGDYGYMKLNSVGRLYTAATIDAALPTGANVIGAVTQSGTWNVGTVTTITNVVHIDDNGGSLTVDGTVAATQSGAWNITNISGTVSLPTGAATLAEQQTQTTSLQLIDDTVYTDDTSTHATGTSKGLLLMAAATPTDAAVNANDIGSLAMTLDRKLHVSVQDPLPAGTNAIGKLSANSGVDIGDVDITSVVPGTTATSLGKAEDAAHASGDTGLFVLGVRNDTLATGVASASGDYSQISVDTSGRILTANAPRALKTSQQTTITSSTSETTVLTAVASTFLDVYGVIVTNTSATVTKVTFKDATAGTTRFVIEVPAAETRGFMLPIDAAHLQSSSNNNWTATCGTSVASVEITVMAVKSV